MSSAYKQFRSKSISRRQFIRAAGIMTVATAVEACTPTVATNVPGGTTPTSVAAVPTAAPAVAKAKQDVIMGIGSDVVTVDSRVTVGAQALSQMSHVIEPMMWPDNSGTPVSILASSWQPTEDGTGWRFKLRPNIEFHNGEMLNAECVKYTIESTVDKANEWVHADPRTNMSIIKEVKVEDDLTVVLVTGNPNRALPIKIYERHILPAVYAAQQGKAFGQQPIGTGHYKFVEHTAGSHLRLEANREYHGFWDGPTKNDTLTFRFLTETATRIAALEAGEVHLIDNLPPDSVERIRNNSKLQVFTTPSARIDGMMFNCGRAPFDNLKARLAVAHAIDKETIVSTIMGGMTSVAEAPFPPGTLGTVGETFPPYAYDPAKAKQYFSEAGLTKGTKIKVGGPAGRYLNDKQVTSAVAGMLSEVGFDPELEQLEWGTYWSKASTGSGYYDLFYAGWATRGYDPADFLIVYTGWDQDGAGVTRFKEKKEQVAELFTKANATMVQEEVVKHYTELAHLLWDNIPVLHLFYEPSVFGASKSLKNWSPRRDGMVYLWNASLE